MLIFSIFIIELQLAYIFKLDNSTLYMKNVIFLKNYGKIASDIDMQMNTF